MQGEASRNSDRNGKESSLKRKWRESALLRELIWKYRKPVFLGLLSLMIVDALEVLPPLVLKQAVDVVVARQPWSQLAWLAAGYFLIAFFQGFCRYAWRMFLIRSSLFAGRDLRNRFSGHLLRLSPSFFDRKRLGDLMSLATNDVEAIRMALGPGLLVAADAIFYFVTVPIAMLALSPRLTLLAFLPLPIIPWLVARNERLIHERFEKVQAAFGRLSAMAQETLTGVRVIKAFAAEPGQLERFRKSGEDYVRLNMSLARVQSAFGPTLDFTMSLGLVFLLWVGGRQVMGGLETLGTFVAFQRYIQKMVWPMTAVGMAITYYQRGIASARRMGEIFSEKSAVREPRVPAPRAIRGEIEFRKLSFRYAPESPLVIQDLSLTIPARTRVAFVGAVGSGKTTLLSLIPRLYPVEAGMICIDGQDVNDYPIQDLRRSVGFVGQDLFLFSESVEENLSWGADQEVPRDEIIELSRSVALETEIQRLPQGYGTLLGERGVNLSGGQRQRVTIARALAKKPAILILDDALSSVD
ncbi:MAG: hypothetical protein RJB38_1854, partial [Pseudomonadota bacterium]